MAVLEEMAAGGCGLGMVRGREIGMHGLQDG